MPAASGHRRQRRVRRRRRPGRHRRRPRRHAAVLTGVRLEIEGEHGHPRRHRPLPARGPRACAGSPSEPDCPRPRWCPARPSPTPPSRSPPATRSPSRSRPPVAAARAWSASRAAAGDDHAGCSTASSRSTARCFPDESPRSPSVDTAALVEAVNGSALVAERNTPVRLRFAAGEVDPRGRQRRGGAGRPRRSTPRSRASDIDDRVQPGYLLDGLGAIDSDAAAAVVHDADASRRCSPASAAGDEAGRRLPLPVMPVRLSG